jgi:TonB family protein
LNFIDDSVAPLPQPTFGPRGRTRRSAILIKEHTPLRKIILLLIAVSVCVVIAIAQEAQPQPQQQAPAPPHQRIRLSAEVLQGRLEHKVKPKYPDEAKQAHLKGTVRLRVLVGEDGSVKEAKPIDGDPVLAKAATDAVLQWRYRPFTLDGRPIQMEGEVDVKF